MLDHTKYDKVRLKPEYLDAIVMAFKQNFASGDHLWIFGSRVDLQARGGDIDLYIETLETEADLAYKRKMKFIVSLCKKIGEQKIDVVTKLMTNKIHLPIYDEAIKNGVQLV